jgi:hypothetical protein
MDAYLSRFDFWHVVLTATPLLAGVVLAALATRWPSHLGKWVATYAAICIAVGMSPLWLPRLALVADGPMRSVIVETKLAFFLGLAVLLAAGGRAIDMARNRAQAPITAR